MALYANNNTTAPVWVVSAPTDYNVTMTNADTEYSQLLPAGCKRFSMTVRDGVATDNFRTAFVTGKVATPTAPFEKLPCTIGIVEQDVNFAAQTVYFACSAAGKIMQIRAWV